MKYYHWPLAKNPARLAEPGQVGQFSRLLPNFPAENFSRLQFLCPGWNFFQVAKKKIGLFDHVLGVFKQFRWRHSNSRDF